MQFGKVITEKHVYKGKVVNEYCFNEQSIAVDNATELYAEIMKAVDFVLKGQSSEVDFAIKADPTTHKLKRIVIKRQVPIDE
jgi:hypothetical protein